MGVKQCSRARCGNIMCDRHSKDYGYLCDSCFEELKSFKPKDVHIFMNTPPPTGEILHPYWLAAIDGEFMKE